MRPGSDSTVRVPPWRSTTIRCAVASPSPVPWPTSLVVKNESNTRSRISARDPGAVVGDLDLGEVAEAASGDRDRPALAERVDRVVEQVGPDLVELGAAHGQLGEVQVQVLLELDLGVLQAVAQHLEGHLEALVHVHLDEFAAVHVGVGLHGPHEVHHPARGLPELVHEAARSERGRQPGHGRTGGRAGQLGHPVEPFPFHPRGGQRPHDAPGLGHLELLQAVDQRVLGIARLESLQVVAALGGLKRVAVQLDQLLGLRALDPRVHEAVDRRPDHVERLGKLPRRALRRGGGVVQLVSQPGRHRAERGQPLAVLLPFGDPAHHGRDLAHDTLVHRGLSEGQAAKVVRLDQGHPALGLRLHAHSERPASEHADRRHPRGRLLAAGRLGAIAVHDQGLRPALQQQLYAGSLRRRARPAPPPPRRRARS